jgi:benzoate-CoA ligase family protein
MSDVIESSALIPEELNIASYFFEENISQGRGNRVAVYYKSERYTYNDLLTLVNQIGNVLKELGVEIENRVYMALQDSPEFVATWYAVQKIGAGIIPGYTYLSPDDYEHEFNLLRPKVIVTDTICIDRLREASQRTKYPKAFLILGASPSNLRKGEYDFHSMVQRASAQLETERMHKDDPSRWAFSGGSTGKPKALCFPQQVLVHAFLSYQQIMRYTQDDVILPIPKVFFAYAATGAIVHPFRVGAGAVLFPERSTPEKIFELVEQHKPTILIQVPTMMRRMLETPKEKRADLSCVRLCTSGGEHLSADLYREWIANFGCEVIDMIGSAELGYVYLSNRPGEVVPGSVGKPIPGYEAKVVDDEGHELPDGEVGVLWAKGPSSVGYYWHGYEKSRRIFLGEWVNTGDLFKRDKEGYFWFVGRKDDLLKVSGYWVHPLEIEKCIQTHPDVVDCAVVGIKDADNLDTTKAFVVLKKGATPNQDKADEIKKFAKEKVSSYKFPRYVEFMDDLPKTKVGKVDRLSLRQRGIYGNY